MSAEDDDYEHWPDEFDQHTEQAVPAQGYDNHNGLHEHLYLAPVRDPSPPNTPPTKKQKIEVQKSTILTYPTLQCAPTTSQHPASPGYIVASGPPPEPKEMPTARTMHYTYHPTYANATPAGTNAWVGRTKTEVEEDNLKIASKEGTYDDRKVVPTGLKDDQMCWVAETNGGHTLRTFVAIKELNGDWKQDPRYPDSWYFVCAKGKKQDG